jgi:hypothetical protein
MPPARKKLSPPSLTTSEVLLVAGTVPCSVNTVKRFLRGERGFPAIDSRLREVISDLRKRVAVAR